MKYILILTILLLAGCDAWIEKEKDNNSTYKLPSVPPPSNPFN